MPSHSGTHDGCAFQDKKKRRVEAAEGAAGADVAADGKKEEEKDLEAGGRRLIPAELLTDDGSAYLEAFKVVNMKDSRKADQVQSVEQVRLLVASCDVL